MAIRASHYYNNPAIGQGFENLAAAFGPPSGSDALGYVSARAKNEEAQRLAAMFDYTRNPNYDRDMAERMSYAAGMTNGTNGYYAQDQNNATARYNVDQDAAAQRYGYDRTFDASRLNNQEDNATALQQQELINAITLQTNDADNITAGQMNSADNARALQERQMQESGLMARQNAEPVILGQGQTAFLPGQTAAATGLAPMFSGAVSANPGEQITMPDGRVISGAEKPLSETEVLGAILQGMPEADQQAAVLGDIPVEQIVGPEGQPQFARRNDAVGQQAYVNPGTPAKPTNGMAVVNGQQVAVMQGPDGKWVEAQTGAPIPDGIPVFDMPKPQGTNEELGVTKPVLTGIQNQLIDAQVARDTATQLRDLIVQSPASQGAVGWIRGTAQNFIQTSGEIGSAFGGEVLRVQQEIAGGMADADLSGAFDPNIPAIEMMANLLAFRFAKMTTGERLSNEMLRATRRSLGLDNLMSNQADSVARLNTAIQMIDRQEQILQNVLSNGVGGPAPAAPAAPAQPQLVPGSRPRAVNPQTGAVVEWDGTAWVPAQ